MIKIVNIVEPDDRQMEAVIRGMRNPMNSWVMSDSHTEESGYQLGDNDLDLMKRLIDGGTTHRKYLRMMSVWMDITAPLYWWKEFDTYKVGTVSNSCSTMHKIHSKEFTLDDFSHEHLFDITDDEFKGDVNVMCYMVPFDILEDTIKCLNYYRDKFNATHDKKYWWQMIQMLPSSYNQKRTVYMNYEVLYHMYHDRNKHKLDEWKEFCDIIIDNVPYAKDLILN